MVAGGRCVTMFRKGRPLLSSWLRHAFAREYILNGGDLATLADILGHSDVTVTKQFYSTFQFSELQEKHQRYSPVARLGLEGGQQEDNQALGHGRSRNRGLP